MASSLIEILFSVKTDELEKGEEELDKLKEKVVDLGKELPTVKDLMLDLIKSIGGISAPVAIAVGAFAAFGFAVGEMVAKSTEAMTAMLELSESLGTPVEKLQPFATAMALAGVSTERLQASLGKLSAAVGNALAEPTGKAASAFQQLGISQKELESEDPETLLKKISAGFADYADSAAKTAAIRELLGKQGPQIVAAMKDEAEMEALAASAQEAYGTKVTEADAKSSKYFGETLKLGMSMFEGVAMSVTKSLLPGLQDLVNQFMESGKAGGFMRDMLDALSATISVVAKVLITTLYIPVKAIIEAFKEFGTALGGVAAAAVQAATGHFKEAGRTLVETMNDINNMQIKAAETTNHFMESLWSSGDAVEKQSDATEKGDKKWQSYNASAKKISDSIKELHHAMLAQLQIQEASLDSMDAYKAAQDAVAEAQLKAKLQAEGATAAQIEQALSYKRAADISKEATKEQVAGLQELARLTEQMDALKSKDNESAKATALISANKEMDSGLQQLIRTKAADIDATKQQIAVDEEVTKLEQLVKKDYDAQIASMTLSTNQLKLYNATAQLTAQYNKDIVGKTPEQIRQLTTALDQAKQELIANNQQTVAWTQSFAGLQAGAQQAMGTIYTQATNLNKMASELTTNLFNNLTTAFMQVGEKGASAFKSVETALVEFIEQAIIKFALLRAAIAAMEAMGVSPATINTIFGAGTVKANANGNAFSAGSIVPFANGGVLSGPTLAPMALMGEAGPEAVMPLQRTANGKLGVAVTGDSSGGGQTVNHNYGGTVIVNTPHDPVEVGKQIKKQMSSMKMITQGEIANAKRPGGQLNRSQGMFAR